MRKKSLLKAAATVIVAVAATCGFSACGRTDGESAHIHSYTETVVAPACTERGYTLHKCDCGDEYRDNEKNPLGHNYSVEFTVDKKATCKETGIESRHCARCGAKTDETEIPFSEHNYVDGVCTVCGDEILEEATRLEYKLSGDGTYYIVKSLGEETRVRFIIPSLYKEKPVKEIGYGAFRDRYGLKSITIPDGVTSIGEYAFKGCRSLTSLTIGKGVTNIGRQAFEGCSSFEDVYITDLVAWCKNKFIYDGLTAKSNNPLEYAHNLYLNGELVTNLVIPKEITEVEDYAFSGCTSVTGVTIHSGVKNLGWGAFQNCTALESAIIPEGVTTISNYAFCGCTSLASLTIPESVTSVGWGVFDECKKLIEVVEKTGYVGKWAVKCYESYAKEIKLKDGIAGIAWQTFAWSSVISVSIPDGLKYICARAFFDCRSLSNVSIPESVTKIEVSAFEGCEKLIKKDGGISYVDKWAINCEAIASTAELRADTAGVANYAFNYCIYLKSVTIPDGVKSIGDYAFGECKKITDIIIPESVTSIGKNAFGKCIGLTSITFNGTKEEWQLVDKGDGWKGNTGEFTVYCTDGTLAKAEA